MASLSSIPHLLITPDRGLVLQAECHEHNGTSFRRCRYWGREDPSGYAGIVGL